jgi:hypothetical protein
MALQRGLCVMRISFLVVMSGLLLALTGCAANREAATLLDQYPGVQQQIAQYYNANASEEGFGCNAVTLDNITHAKVVRETSSQLVLAINYFFISEFGGGRLGPGCEGFGTRIFTFDRANGGYSLVGMTGEQRNDD